MMTTDYKLKFRNDVDNAVLCEKTLNGDELQKFRSAVLNDYYFQVRGAMIARLGWPPPPVARRRAGARRLAARRRCVVRRGAPRLAVAPGAGQGDTSSSSSSSWRGGSSSKQQPAEERGGRSPRRAAAPLACRCFTTTCPCGGSSARWRTSGGRARSPSRSSTCSPTSTSTWRTTATASSRCAAAGAGGGRQQAPATQPPSWHTHPAHPSSRRTQHSTPSTAHPPSTPTHPAHPPTQHTHPAQHTQHTQRTPRHRAGQHVDSQLRPQEDGGHHGRRRGQGAVLLQRQVEAHQDQLRAPHGPLRLLQLPAAAPGGAGCGGWRWRGSCWRSCCCWRGAVQAAGCRPQVSRPQVAARPGCCRAAPPQRAAPRPPPPSRAQIHWFSIINSCVTVVLLTGFLATILLRVLKNDFVKYTRDDEMGEEQEETGWKYLHGDVFRCARVGEARRGGRRGGRRPGAVGAMGRGSVDGLLGSGSWGRRPGPPVASCLKHGPAAGLLRRPRAAPHPRATSACPQVPPPHQPLLLHDRRGHADVCHRAVHLHAGAGEGPRLAWPGCWLLAAGCWLQRVQRVLAAQPGH
jgi:hypothetical protein